jgi:hypothetical protein
MKKQLPRVFVWFFVLLLLSAAWPQSVYAAPANPSCYATVNKPSVSASSENVFTFTVTNTNPSNDIKWVKITRPSENFILNSDAGSGWPGSVSSTDATYGNGTISPTDHADFLIDASAQNKSAASADWLVETSINDDGSGSVPCTGSLGTAIGGGPTVSDITISGVTSDSVVLSYTTSESTTSVVSYGTTTAYGTAKSDTSTTSHAVTLDGLSANTTYHFQIVVTGDSGTTAVSDNTFATAQVGQTGTTTTITVSTTRVVTPAPTPTPKPDTSPPRVSITTDIIDKVFTVVPTINGTATDQSGVATLEYSLDDGKSYLPVDTIASAGRTSTAFEFTPESLLDDNYVLKIRAADVKGNTGETAIGTFIIDRLPPRIGGNVASLGPQMLVPTPDGSYVVPAGIDFKITLSAVGGPTSIDLEYIGDQSTLIKVPLTKNPDNGLWSGLFRFGTAGTYTLTAAAIDGAKNKAERVVGTVVVVPNGQVTSGNSPVTNGRISVYYLDNTMKKFVLWDGSAYGQTNPAPLDSEGRYRLYLPSGTYYFDIAAEGYQSLVSSIFTIPQAYPIVTNFNLTHARAIRIWKWSIPLPDFRVTSATITVGASTSGVNPAASALVGHELPYFRFQNGTNSITSLDLRGKPTVVTFLNTWLPSATSQMAILDEVVKNQEINALVVVPQETVSSVSIFKERGGYSVPVVADPDGDLVDPLMLRTMPTHIIVNRKGVITAVKSGVFIKDELFDMIIQ